MAEFTKKIKTSFGLIFKGNEGLNLKSIRPSMLIYALAYMFELMFFACHLAFFEDAYNTTFGISPALLMNAVHMLMSLIIMLLWSKKFKHLIYFSLAITVLSFAAFPFVPAGIPKLVCAVLTLAGLGGCVTTARCGFAFAANNAERLLGVVLTITGTAVLFFLQAAFPAGTFLFAVIYKYMIPIVTLTGLAFCLLFFREPDLEIKEESTKADSKGLYWAFVVFITYFSINGYMSFIGCVYFPGGALISGIGCVIALVLFVAIMLKKRGIWNVWNLFLGVAILMAVFSNLAQWGFATTAVHLLFGVNHIGWITVLYLLACAQRRFASLKLLKKCTLIYVIVAPVTALSDELARMFFPEHITLVFLVYIGFVTSAFLLASPAISKHVFSAIWIGDLQKKDMTLIREKVEETDRFENFGLTPREKEVAVLLLAANTARMIAGALKISPSTVNMHSANLYRKLNINSKAELFQKFGVTEIAEAQEVK